MARRIALGEGLFGSQGDHGVDAHGATGRDGAGSECNDGQQSHDARQYKRVERPEAVYFAGHGFLQGSGTDHTQNQADGHELESLAQNQLENAGAGAAKGDANTNFASAPRDQIRQHAVNAKRRQEQGDSAESVSEKHESPARRQREVHAFGHGMDVEDRQVRIKAADFRAKGADDGSRIGSGLEGESETAGGLLGIGEIVSADGRAGTIEAFVAQRACDTDNSQPNGMRVNFQKIFAVAGEIHAAADRIAVRPEMLRQALVNNNHARGILVVAVIEAAAAEHGNAQGFEITSSHGDV